MKKLCTMVVYASVIRKRVLWSTYILDRDLALNHGIPLPLLDIRVLPSIYHETTDIAGQEIAILKTPPSARQAFRYILQGEG
jgi:hypothetical protein